MVIVMVMVKVAVIVMVSLLQKKFTSWIFCWDYFMCDKCARWNLLLEYMRQKFQYISAVETDHLLGGRVAYGEAWG